MAVTSSSGVQSVMSGLWVQIQQQVALRNVDQAERQASILRAKADSAQSVAERARESARSLNIQANQAQSEATQARLGLATQKAVGEVQIQLADRHDQIVQVLQAGSLTQTTPPPAPVINALGQSTGNIVNVTA